MKLEVYNKEGQATGRNVDIPDEIFGIEPNEHAVYLAVKQYNASQRQGTHKSKERGEIKGSTRKIKRQKGTGTARAGSIKNPLFRGGGRIFGPKPRNYTIRLNKKVKRIARASALSYKASEGHITVMEDISFEAPRTKDFVSLLTSFECADSKTLLVTGDYNKNVFLSGRNISKAGVVNAKDLNTYEILNADKILLSESAIDAIKETFA